MASELQYHGFRCTSERQACTPQLPSFSRCNVFGVVQSLNNRASVQVSIGNFSRASHIYHVALGILMEVAQRSDDTSKQGTMSISIELANAAMEVMDDCDDYFEDPEACWTQNLSRLSRSSRLKTSSYGGQGIHRPSEKWMHHQIYSLPIVMEDSEWTRAPTQVCSFVLIFNSALCSHLRGMELLSQRQCCTSNDHCEAFETAKTLYELALNALSDAQSMTQTSLFLLGVDKLCFPAVFNNLSHVCKTLYGSSCSEGRHYDVLLLKTVYWLLSTTKDQARLQDPSQRSQDVSMGDAPTTASLPNATNVERRSAGSPVYDEGEEEILDAFLENVFYLIGAPESTVPVRI